MMILRNNKQGIRLVLGTIAAAGMLACLGSTAMAQGWQNGDSQHRTHQDGSWNNGNNGFHGDRAWGNNNGTDSHGHTWRSDGNGRHYHHFYGNSGYEWSDSDQRSSYYVHHYRGREHRRYYTYGGNQFYINLDTGIRIRL